MEDALRPADGGRPCCLCLGRRRVQVSVGPGAWRWRPCCLCSELEEYTPAPDPVGREVGGSE